MANDFSGDANCIALWRMESGALTADSKGGNTLTNSGVAEDLVNFKEGACSGAFVQATNDNMTIADADLDSGFPLKNGEANLTFSIALWFKLSSINIYHFLINKGVSTPNRCVNIYVDNTNKLRFAISDNGSTSTYYIHASALQSGRWYHLGITRDGVNPYPYRIRIWDDTAGAILGVDKTGNSIIPFINNVDLYLGYTANSLNGNEDEVLIFNDVLSIAEIDAIRQGTYGGGAPAAVHKFGSLNRDYYGQRQKTGLYAEI